MTEVQKFQSSPSTTSHPIYADSVFSSGAPEQATSEVLLGSTYRKLLLGIHDREVDLEKIPNLPKQLAKDQDNLRLWETLLLEKKGIASPILNGQKGSSVRLQLMPLVPNIGAHACVKGGVRSRWFPANLLIQTLGAGYGPDTGSLVNEITDSLSVTEEDDIFARFIEESFESVTSKKELKISISDKDYRSFRNLNDHFNQALTPAEQFCIDIKAVIKLKPYLTRRQWTVMLEAILRIGLSAHILWMCQLNYVFYNILIRVLNGDSVPTKSNLLKQLWIPHSTTRPFLVFGNDGTPGIEQNIEHYVYGRYGINLLLHRLQDMNLVDEVDILGYTDSKTTDCIDSLVLFLEILAKHRAKISPSDSGIKAGNWLKSTCAQILESDKGLKLLRFNSGFTKNLNFFLRYSLGQVAESSSLDQISYDQSYLLTRKKRKNSPATVQPGPSMLILLVHVCQYFHKDMPASIEDLRRHLGNYGLQAPSGELTNGRLGSDLQKLGLVIDSPDAAGGRLLVAPFPIQNHI